MGPTLLKVNGFYKNLTQQQKEIPVYEKRLSLKSPTWPDVKGVKSSLPWGPWGPPSYRPPNANPPGEALRVITKKSKWENNQLQLCFTLSILLRE